MAKGVQLVRSKEDAKRARANCWARPWSPTRPAPRGRRSSRCWSPSATTSPSELYLGLAVDRELQCPVLMATTEGGVDIEIVAHETPEKIHREPIDVGTGLADFQARKVCQALGLKGERRATARSSSSRSSSSSSNDRRLARRDQPPDRHRQGGRPGPRRQAQLRRQRDVPPQGHRRADRRRRGRPQRAAGRQERPELRQPRRRHRLPGQRRRAGHEHDGPDQVPRRRAGQLPRRRRRGPEGSRSSKPSGSCWPTPTSRGFWSTSSAGS